MSNTGQRGFHWVDYVIFGATLMVSSGIGIYYAFSGGRQKTTAEYLVGDRKMKVLPVAFSLLVTFESSIMMLGYPAEMYVYGTMYWWTACSLMLSCFIGSQIVAPLFHPLQVTSGYEYLEQRFKSHVIRLLASFFGIMTNLWYMGIVLFGPATALEAVTGFPKWASILGVALAAIFYTSIGGIKAVIWADVFQFLVMVVGMLSVIIKGFILVGGVGKVVEICKEGNRLQFFDFNPDPTVRHTSWSLFIGNTVRLLSFQYYQSSIQRISSMETVRAAKWIILISAPGFFFFSTMAAIEGLISYAYFTEKKCDPLEAGYVTNPNQVLPYFVMEIFRDYPGLSGLFLASLFSASLSTLSSCLSSISALVWRDFLRFVFKGAPDSRATLIAKSSVTVFGILAIGICFLIMKIGGPITQISGSMLSSFAGPLTGLFLLGSLFPCANKKGAITGALVSITLSLWISMGSTFTSSETQIQPWLLRGGVSGCMANSTVTESIDRNVTYLMSTSSYSEMANTEEPISRSPVEWIYSLSYMWFGLIGVATVLIVGIGVSICTGMNTDDPVEEKYILHVLPWIPHAFRRLICCTNKNIGPNKLKPDLKKEPYMGTVDGNLEIELKERMLTTLQSRDEDSIPVHENDVKEA